MTCGNCNRDQASTKRRAIGDTKHGQIPLMLCDPCWQPILDAFSANRT